jgi:hypothetical protein
MKSKQQLIMNQTLSNEALGKLQRLSDAVGSKIDAINADTSRSPGWKNDEVKKARDAALPGIGDQLRTVQQLAAVALVGQEMWQSKAFVLSQQRFSDDPAADATIRLAKLEELALMPRPLLAMTLQDAKESRNFALVYCAWLTGTSTPSASGLEGAAALVIDDLELPDRAAALAAISACVTNKATAESIATLAAGTRLRPIDKMNLGRQQQATSRMVAAADAAPRA